MHQTIGIVQARLGSTRLKGKLARKVGGKSLLEWVVRRATESHLLDQVVVAAGDGPDDDDIRALVPADVPVFIGSERDVLGRFVTALDAHPAAAVFFLLFSVMRLWSDPDIIPQWAALYAVMPKERNPTLLVPFDRSSERNMMTSTIDWRWMSEEIASGTMRCACFWMNCKHERGDCWKPWFRRRGD